MPTNPRPAAAPRDVTPDLIVQALACIPADIDRETWARLAMAIKSEMSDEAGFTLWDEWSRRAEGYDQRAARDTWRSIKAGGRVRVGTLFAVAKGHGFQFPNKPQAVTPEQRAAAAQERQRVAAAKRLRDQEEVAQLLRDHEAAATRCVQVFDGAALQQPAAGAGYLRRKGVGAHGLRFLGGVAVVPMCDADGRLWSIQRLLPKRLRDQATGQDGTDKLYGPAKAAPGEKWHSRKSGLFHLIGQVEGAALLLMAEGYATAATLHEATGLSVVVCFDSGNLVHVARALRERWPALPILVCGDDDRQAEAAGKKNAGKVKAHEAAGLAGAAHGLAAAVLPAGLPEDGSDWNDLAACTGAGAVREQVEAAAAALLASAATAAAASAASGTSVPSASEGEAPAGGAKVVPIRGRASRGKAGSPAAAGGGRGADGGAGPAAGGGDGGRVPPPKDSFILSDTGVWFVQRDADGEEKKPVWLCAPLRVTARTRTEEASGWGCLLEFSDFDGNAKAWAMPYAMLSGDSTEWFSRLRDMGLHTAHGARQRSLLARYIDSRKPPTRVTCTDRVGWHDDVYVLPSSCIVPQQRAEDARRFVFQSEGGLDDTFRRQGTLQAWQSGVAALAVGNSRFGFAICVALAGPLVRLAGVESGGFHFRSSSSAGKTTALKLAASVWGAPSFMQRWRSTDNALEATAVQHCDSTLILDELAQLDPKVAGECAYMLANEQEKGRATRGAQMRKRRSWRLLFLSSGEVSLAQHLAEANKKTQAGMEVRMLDIPMEAGMGMGAVEELHGCDRAEDLVGAMVGAAAAAYGTAGRAWLQWLSNHYAAAVLQVSDLLPKLRDMLVPESAAEQVRRAGTRFALVAAAGEMATAAGITGWPAGEATRAVRDCFNAWLGARGHTGNSEPVAMVVQVRQFLELHGEGRFTWWHRAADDHNVKTLNRAGFRRLLGDDGRPVKSNSDHVREFGETISQRDMEHARVEYIVLKEVFEREVCRGFDSQAVARVLKQCGHLKGEDDRFMDRQRLPLMGGKIPCYRILPSIFIQADAAN